jgi:hypothetical protein
MPTFMDSLAANPAGSSSVYGQPAAPNNGDVLNIVNNLKDREMQDFKNKANFMSDLSIKQDRLKSLFNPNQGWNPSQQSSQQSSQGQQPQQMNTVFRDPNALSGYEKGELGIRQQGINLDQQKMAQAGRMGEQALGIKSQQEQLAQQKSDQINTMKNADMQRKIDESSQKLQLAQQALENKSNSAEQTLQAHKDLAAAVEERHKLELTQKDAQFQQTSDMHQKAIDAMQQKLDQAKHSSTTTELDASGNKKTVTTNRGSRISVVGPNGESGTVDANETLPDGWSKKPGGGE